MAPAYDVARGTRTMQCLRELEESQWWPLDRIQEMQAQRLRRLVQYAYGLVPHYRSAMKERGVFPSDIRTAADLVALPVLTRSFIQEHREELVAEGFPRERLRSTQTSGSTGIPLQFYSTQQDQWDHGLARAARGRGWAGLRFGDRTVAVGRPRVCSGRVERVLKRLSRRFQRTAFINADALSDEALPRIVNELASSGVRGIRGYPEAIALLAGAIKEAGLPGVLVHSVVTGGEQLLEHERGLMREVFRTEPYSKYSSYEAFEIAAECAAHEGMHVAAEDLIVEIVDDEGVPLPPGIEGRILVTNLHNYGMPLLRYELGDSGTMLEGTCPCGRTLPRLGSLVARRNNYFVSRTGRRVFPGMMFFDRLAGLGLRQYQVVQETVEDVVMRLVPPRGLSADELAALEGKVTEMYRSNFGEEFIFHVEFVERIQPTPAGKHTFMVSMVQSH